MRAARCLAVVGLLALSLGGCRTAANLRYCDENVPCHDAQWPYCDLTARECVASGGQQDGAVPEDGGRTDAAETDVGPTCTTASCPTGICNGTTCVPCPADMVPVPPKGVCIDRYEASNGGGGVAASVAGVLPWVNVTQTAAAAACVAAGKRLCDETEWFAACSGPAPGTTYPYGNTYGANTCNGVDHGVAGAVNTGSMTACVGGYPGLYDMGGNVWEWTSTCAGGVCRVRGGSFISAATDLRCGSRSLDSDPTYSDNHIGFRCCRAP